MSFSSLVARRNLTTFGFMPRSEVSSGLPLSISPDILFFNKPDVARWHLHRNELLLGRLSQRFLVWVVGPLARLNDAPCVWEARMDLSDTRVDVDVQPWAEPGVRMQD